MVSRCVRFSDTNQVMPIFTGTPKLDLESYIANYSGMPCLLYGSRTLGLILVIQGGQDIADWL